MAALPAQGDPEFALRAYLALLAGRAPSTHFLEVRYRVGDQQLGHEFHHVYDDRALIRAVRSRGSRTDVYVGCAPRSRRQGTKDAVSQVWVLWAECDGEEAARRLQRFRPLPSLVIASGSGSNCHGYWPLTAPLTPRQAEMANLRLAHALQADRACFDASRILRPPGTWNFKHDPPRPVGVLRLDAQLRFNVEEITGHLPEVSDEIVRRRWDAVPRSNLDDPLLSIPPRHYVADLLGVKPGRNNKVSCPFHNDDRPSLHVYPTGDRGWCCFSCRRGGTIYDLAAAIWGMQTRGRDFVEVRRRLTELYGRGIDRSRIAARSLER
ncbi:CHC2 zinc finger domain-containing protein [Solirubrobacter ginsenosidimutans]|uniref:CHC2 zinc finger domain-containing protein n=1 Tax=Solirubrobacter ginsenosidimutans TaxID=490573 RepID=A0A9X3MXH5_9ACTN|nr:CHC2 zinc finger domain-containing protein [Solirubrobacter ginsenosidimutans]MDA0161258.1 CHC2 zinc finger domain-containing protein [Solirubrobacter ginsenosidimutans]